MKSILFYITLFLLFNVTYLNLVAQDFEVAPVKLFFTSDPGESQMKSLTIKNHSNAQTNFTIKVGDFLPTSAGDKQFMSANSTKNSLADWITINPSYITLNPGQEGQINISIQVPSESNASRWGILYIQPAKEQTPFDVGKGVGTGLNLKPTIIVYLYQTPASNNNNLVKVSNLVEISKDNDGNRIFTVDVENQGDRIASCKVYLIAGNLNNAEEKFYAPVFFDIFPQMLRNMQLTLPPGLPPGKYALSAILDYGSKTTLEGTQIIIDVK